MPGYEILSVRAREAWARCSRRNIFAWPACRLEDDRRRAGDRAVVSDFKSSQAGQAGSSHRADFRCQRAQGFAHFSLNCSKRGATASSPGCRNCRSKRAAHRDAGPRHSLSARKGHRSSRSQTEQYSPEQEWRPRSVISDWRNDLKTIPNAHRRPPRHPAYMAPEQAAGDPKSIGPLTDVYAWRHPYEMLMAGRRFAALTRWKRCADSLHGARAAQAIAARRVARLGRFVSNVWKRRRPNAIRAQGFGR